MNIESILLDFVAIGILSSLYFHRYYRREVLVACIGLNVAVVAATAALTGTAITMGLGLGLFGVLSIIRLRSSELTHAEVAYYFVSLAMGLLAGLNSEPLMLGRVLIVALVVVMFVVDHPRVLSGYRIQNMTLEGIYTDERTLIADLEGVLGASIKAASITKVDMIRGTTSVDIRYRLDPARELTPPILKPAEPDLAPAAFADAVAGLIGEEPSRLEPIESGFPQAPAGPSLGQAAPA